MITATELRKGVTFELEGQLHRVLDYQHTQLGRGSANIRVKVKNLNTGTISEKVFGSNGRFQDVRLETRQVQYLYADGDLHYFMDLETYEQPALPREQLGEGMRYLKEGVVVNLLAWDGRPVEVELPTTVDLRVTRTDPGFRGDTATGGTKPATVETGLTVQVPLFVQQGETIRVDTRTGSYITRV